MSKKPTPLTQGDVTGECVIYSALNAVRLLWPEHFDELEPCEKLYGAIIKAMNTDSVKEMLVDGTESDAAEHIGDIVSGILLSGWGAHLDVVRQFPAGADHIGIDGFFRLLRLDIADPGQSCAAIVGLDDPWDHWSVIHEITDKSVLFYDSYGPMRLTRRNWGAFTLSNEAGKIQIDAPATVIYRRLYARTA